MEWQNCNKQGYIKKIGQDRERIKDIIKSAEDREKTAGLLPLNETTKETIITLSYDVLRELLEALALKHNFKIYNHECYSSFLKNVIKDDTLALEFDSLRLLRNSINYYGKRIDLSDSKIILNKLVSLIKTVKGLLS